MKQNVLLNYAKVKNKLRVVVEVTNADTKYIYRVWNELDAYEMILIFANVLIYSITHLVRSKKSNIDDEALIKVEINVEMKDFISGDWIPYYNKEENMDWDTFKTNYFIEPENMPGEEENITSLKIKCGRIVEKDIMTGPIEENIVVIPDDALTSTIPGESMFIDSVDTLYTDKNKK